MTASRKLAEEVLEISQQVLGPEHFDTLGSMNNLASILRAQGELRRACDLRKEVLSITRRTRGQEDPYTTLSAWNLIPILQDLGEASAARVVLESDLLWMIYRDPLTLGKLQRGIREQLLEAFGAGR